MLLYTYQPQLSNVLINSLINSITMITILFIIKVYFIQMCMEVFVCVCREKTNKMAKTHNDHAAYHVLMKLPKKWLTKWN